MAAGLRIYDASGNLHLDITTRLNRFVGSHVLDGTVPNGAFSDPLLTNGTPFFTFQPQQLWGFVNSNTAFPTITVSGITISWSYSPSGASSGYLAVSGTVYYGVY